MDEAFSIGEGGIMIESSNEKDLIITEGGTAMEPYVGMEFESGEAAFR